MIAQRLASEPVIAVRRSISLFLSLFLCAAERGIMEAVCPGGGEPFVVRKSTVSRWPLGVCVCVCDCVFVSENEDKMAPAGGQSRLEPVGRGQWYYHRLCSLW